MSTLWLLTSVLFPSTQKFFENKKSVLKILHFEEEDTYSPQTKAYALSLRNIKVLIVFEYTTRGNRLLLGQWSGGVGTKEGALSKQLLCQIDVSLKINSTAIERSDLFKYLGVVINQTISWSEHTDTISTKYGFGCKMYFSIIVTVLFLSAVCTLPRGFAFDGNPN